MFTTPSQVATVPPPLGYSVSRAAAAAPGAAGYDSAERSSVVLSSGEVESVVLGVREGETRAGSEVVSRLPLFSTDVGLECIGVPRWNAQPSVVSPPVSQVYLEGLTYLSEILKLHELNVSKKRESLLGSVHGGLQTIEVDEFWNFRV